MNFFLETDRLFLRAFSTEDAEDMYNLNLDPLVLKYTGDKPFSSIEAAKQFLLRYDHYEKYGMGRWAVILKEKREFLGWCGLKYWPDKKWADIGFRFYRHAWGKGFATESAKICLKYGSKNKNLENIIGRVRIENEASIRVLEKIGMSFIKEISFDHHPGFLYAWEPKNFYNYSLE